jgi:hypothetical protein
MYGIGRVRCDTSTFTLARRSAPKRAKKNTNSGTDSALPCMDTPSYIQKYRRSKCNRRSVRPQYKQFQDYHAR